MNKALALIIFLTCVTLYSNQAVGQTGINRRSDTLLVKLQPRVGDVPVKRVKAGRLQPDHDLYRGLPQDLEVFRIFVFDFQYPDAVYPMYLKSKQEKQQLALINPYTPKGESTANLLSKSGVAVLSGKKGNKKIVICDANNDQDFSNDKRVEYNISDTIENIRPEDLPAIPVKYEYLYEGKIIQRQITIKIYPYYKGFLFKRISFSDPHQMQLQVCMSLEQFPEGSFSCHNQKYKIALPSPIFMDGNYKKSHVLIGKAGSEFVMIVPPLFEKETLTLQGNDIMIAGISELGDWVKLAVTRSEAKRIGIRVGEQVEPLSLTTLDGKLINSSYNFKPYILLEFWGTWCKPCIAGIPALKTLYQENKANLNLVSVAYDHDVNKVKSFVKRNNLNWLHTFVQYRQPDRNSLIEKLQIDAFPTFILLDNNFNILARGTSEKALAEIEAIIKK